MKSLLIIFLIFSSGCVSNIKSGRGIAAEDATSMTEPSELEEAHAFRYGTVSNPEWVVNTYIPEGSRLEIDPNLVDQQMCNVSINKENKSGSFWLEISVNCRHAIQSNGRMEIERCGFLTGFSEAAGAYRAVDIPRDTSRPGRIYYDANLGGLVSGPTEVYNHQGLYTRMVIEVDPLTDQPQRMSVEYRQGLAGQEFGNRALQALFTCEMNQTTASHFY